MPTGRATRHLLDAHDAIFSAAPNGNDIAFYPSVFCSIYLPRSRFSGEVYEHRYRNWALQIESGHFRNHEGLIRQPIPYGGMARLLIATLTTEAIRFGSAEVSLCRSQSEFLRRSGLATYKTNQTHGDVHRSMMQQLLAISTCVLSYRFQRAIPNEGSRQVHVWSKPISKFVDWGDESVVPRSAWPGTLTFSAEFFDDLANHSVPIDRRALLALKQSPLAIDIYVFLAQRFYSLKYGPLDIRWESLADQFGYRQDRVFNFRKQFRNQLPRVQLLYKDCEISCDDHFIRLYPSPTPVPQISKSDPITGFALNAETSGIR